MAQCPECHGEGVVLLFQFSQTCPTCNGRREVPDEREEIAPVEQPAAAEPELDAPGSPGRDGPEVLKATGVGHRWTWGFTQGAVSLGCGGAITISGGSGVPAVRLHGEHEHLYLTTTSQDAPNAVVRFVSETLRRFEETRDHVPGVLGPLTYCCGFFSLEVLADMLGELEQEGHVPVAFVASCRDFADVRKMKDPQHVRWEGKRAWVYGLEVLVSREVPVGYFTVASTDRLVLAQISR